MPALAHSRPDHDETLIARFAANDLDEREAADAREVVAACPACGQLDADLRSIMAATAALPAPRRTRDFRLTDADAARLRRTGWRRLMGRFGDPRLAFTRPLATGLVTLGIAGLVFAAAPSFLAAGTAASAPALAPGTGGAVVAQATEQTSSAQYGADGAAPSAGAVAIPGPSNNPVAAASAPPPGPATLESSPEPRSSGAPNLGLPIGAVPASGPLPAANDKSAQPVESGPGSPNGPSALLILSVALVLVGIGLFLLRWVARRTA